MPTSVVELLQQLIRIPSVNPDGDPGTEHTCEANLAAWIAPWIAKLGYTVTLDEIKPQRPNLIARAPGPMDRPRILLGPHLDTVGVGGMCIDPFSGDLRDGRVWGRGASDTKGPMAAMLWALHECRDILETLPVAVDFVGFMAEESGQWGSKDFAEQYGADYEFALVGEPTSLHLVHVTKGALWATLNAEGVAAHSSQPERGDNAILKLTRCLDLLDRELRQRLTTFTHPILGHATLNVGVISGGTRANIVPAHAEAQIDIRTVPALLAEHSTLRVVQAFLQEHDLPLTISNVIENPPMEVPADHEWMSRILQIHPSSKAVGAPWFSDAAHLNAAGLASICIGPGSIDQAHTKDEFISVIDLEAGAAWFTALLRALA
ncbi:MAG: M20 family metallopeptidase [Verrucomicrobia bacterium]|nr:M20 family metallopeptidase [Verrucomicrobiota bacterium]